MQMLVPTAVENNGAEPNEVDARPATSGDTGPSLFWQQVACRGETVVLRHKHLGVWQEITWSAFGENVRACAYGLMALEMQEGDRITILSEDRPEWLYADLAIQSAAGLSVGIYPTSGASQASYVVANSESKILLVEDQEQFDKVASTRHELPELEWVIVMDPKGVHEDDPTVMTFDELLERGRELERVEPRRLDERLALVKPDDTAFIIYTSGTTGPPKGAMHSHRSVLDGAKPLLACLGVTDREESIIYLPLCHAGERFFSYTRMLLVGGIYSIVESPETLFADTREVAPTFFVSVYR